MSVTTEVKLNEVNIGRVAELVEKIQANPDKAQTKWSAEVHWKKGFQSEAKIRSFEGLQSDEPAGLGGDDNAPNPVEQVLAAFGNCLAVGYAANATTRNIKLDGLKIELEGDLNLKTFLGLAQGNAGYENVRARVHIKSNASSEQLDELHKAVVASSPVGHTLSRAVPINVELEN